MMPSQVPAKPGSLKDPAVAALFSNKDPEQRFEGLREIGHGSFGAVFFAQDTETNETVAIKKMAFSGKQAAEKWTDIIKEVSFLKNVSHQNIVDYRACYLKEHTCWLVMEYCIGSAADIVEVHRRPLRECEIAAIVEQTLCGLAYLHDAGRIHRDVKAGNILLTDSGVVKLADFGSASIICPAQSFVGTPYWMAPEVILAMDEGHYDQSADIWSLGITCIELAERRPPLFNMNAMSALYHIAQNDPPGLAIQPIGENTIPWSKEFHSFVEQCLLKDPRQRMSTRQCQRHEFLIGAELDGVLPELIARTKALVSDLDHFQYRKMRKLIYLDEQQSTLTTDGVSVSEKHDAEDEYLGVGSAGMGSRSNSISSFQSVHSGQVDSNVPSERAVKRSNSRPPIPAHMLLAPTSSNGEKAAEEIAEKNRTIIRVGDEESTHSGVSSNRSESSLAGESASTAPASSSVSPHDSFHRPINDEMATLRRSKFSTLRTTKLISKEMEEHSRENNIYEQMSGYKRLRQQHQKELRQLEERCAVEMDALKQKTDKEYEQLINTFSKELQRARNSQNAERDKKSREYDDMERKLRRQLTSQQDNELKAFSNAQKKEYKHNKERAKSELKERYGLRAVYENALKETKAALNARRTDAEAVFAREQRLAMDAEIRRLRRTRMVTLHILEEKLTADELNVRARQLETSHALLRRHHEQTKELENAQLNECQRMKRKHMEAQHEAETSNQLQYNQRVQDELLKKHALQSKQQPKELKAKELMIRKQYRQAVKTQLRQSKVLQAQVLNSIPKEEHRDMIAKLKDEQKRKLAILAGQYETTIESMVQDLTVKLESWQEDEAKALKERLEKELDMLQKFQSRQKSCLEANSEREQQKLAERIAIRKAVLDEKMLEESNIFESERRKVLSELEEKHRAELLAFDENRSQQGDLHAVPSLSSSSQLNSLSALRALSTSLHSLTTSS